MKTKDKQALHQKTQAELQQMLSEHQLELAQSRMKKKVGKLENTSLIKTLSDNIARIKTIIRIKQLSATTEPAKEIKKKA